MSDSERLIAMLAAEARPVRRLRPPLARAALWLLAAGAVVALSVAYHGVQPASLEALAAPREMFEWLLTLATAIGAVVAAFYVSLPDRSPRWALLGIVPAVAWLASAGFGCLVEIRELGAAAFAWGEPWLCLRYIAEMGVPLTAIMLLMLRHAGPLRPRATMLLAALGMAALSAVGLAFFHPDHTAWLGLLWHGAALAIVLAGGALGAAVLRKLYAPRY